MKRWHVRGMKYASNAFAMEAVVDAYDSSDVRRSSETGLLRFARNDDMRVFAGLFET